MDLLNINEHTSEGCTYCGLESPECAYSCPLEYKVLDIQINLIEELKNYDKQIESDCR